MIRPDLKEKLDEIRKRVKRGTSLPAQTLVRVIHDLCDDLEQLLGYFNRQTVRNDGLQATVNQLSSKLEATEARAEAYYDAARYLVPRANVSPAEQAQLNLGTLFDQGDGTYTIAPYDLRDIRDVMLSSDKALASEAKFRNLKSAFVGYQQYVNAMLTGLDNLGKSNVVTKEDLRKLREIRDDIRATIQR